MPPPYPVWGIHDDPPRSGYPTGSALAAAQQISTAIVQNCRRLRTSVARCRQLLGDSRLAALFHRVEEFAIVLRRFQLIDEEFGRFQLIHGKHHLAQDPHALEDFGLDE
jgi:hypothetical protein